MRTRSVERTLEELAAATESNSAECDEAGTDVTEDGAFATGVGQRAASVAATGATICGSQAPATMLRAPQPYGPVGASWHVGERTRVSEVRQRKRHADDLPLVVGAGCFAALCSVGGSRANTLNRSAMTAIEAVSILRVIGISSREPIWLIVFQGCARMRCAEGQYRQLSPHVNFLRELLRAITTAQTQR